MDRSAILKVSLCNLAFVRIRLLRGSATRRNARLSPPVLRNEVKGALCCFCRNTRGMFLRWCGGKKTFPSARTTAKTSLLILKKKRRGERGRNCRASTLTQLLIMFRHFLRYANNNHFPVKRKRNYTLRASLLNYTNLYLQNSDIIILCAGNKLRNKLLP